MNGAVSVIILTAATTTTATIFSDLRVELMSAIIIIVIL
jgi:hypothetical protein